MNLFRRLNVNHYIDEDLQKKCYPEWVKVRRCSDKFLGEEYTTFLDVARECNFGNEMEVNRDREQYYDLLHKNKLSFWGPDHLERIGEEGEEAAEEEAEEE